MESGDEVLQRYQKLIADTHAQMVGWSMGKRVPVAGSWHVPRGQMLVVGGLKILHPSDMLSLFFPNRHPYHTIGHREARRDRRKYGNRRIAYPMV